MDKGRLSPPPQREQVPNHRQTNDDKKKHSSTNDNILRRIRLNRSKPTDNKQLPNHRRRNSKAFEEHVRKHVPSCFVTEDLFRGFKDVVFEDVVFDNNSSVAPY